MKDENNYITIPKFYDNVVELSGSEKVVSVIKIEDNIK